MRRFWSDLLASLYNIKDGIVKKKQELDEERVACEAEKEELRGQIEELNAQIEELENNTREGVIEEPVAYYKDYDGSYIVKPFNSWYPDYSNTLNWALYKKDQLNYDENSGTYNLKQGKIYLSDNGYFNESGAKLYSNDVYNVEVHPFVVDGNCINLYDGQSYNIPVDWIMNEDNIDLSELVYVIKIYADEPSL